MLLHERFLKTCLLSFSVIFNKRTVFFFSIMTFLFLHLKSNKKNLKVEAVRNNFVRHFPPNFMFLSSQST